MKNKLLIVIICSALFIPFLGDVHLFDWDEINFAESAREMIVTSDYLKVQIGFKEFHEKPPLFMWLQAASMNLFGVNEFAARLPNAIAGIIIILLLFEYSRKRYSIELATAWVFSYVGSLLPFFYFKTGIIDPIFNGFIFWSVLNYFDYIKNNSSKNLIYSITLISLAVLTKGPVGLLLAMLTIKIFLFINKKLFQNVIALLAYFFIPLIVYLFWYFVAFGFGYDILIGFFEYHIKLLTTGDSGHSGPIYYHIPILLFGVFPASFFALPQFFKKNKNEFDKLILILFLVVLIIFSIVQTKILHYSSLCYLPMTYFSAKYLVMGNHKNYFVFVFATILAVVMVAFPFVMNNISEVKADSFTSEVLKTNVEWGIVEAIPGIVLLAFSIIYLLKKNYKYIFLGVSISAFILLPIVAPKIEKYTQAANIEFWEKQADKDVFLMPLGYKSYAHYFYGNLKPDEIYKTMTNDELKSYLLRDSIKKDAYFSTKITKLKNYDTIPGIEVLYKKNGFVFLKKESSK